MRALRVHRPGGEFVVEDLPVPEPGAGEVLVEVRAAAVLPNMVVLLSQPSPFPIIFPSPPYTLGSGGATGIVRALGQGVEAFKEGDRVFISEVLACGECKACRRGERNYCDRAGEMGLFAYSASGVGLLDKYRDGAMAEYIRVPAQNLAMLPENLDFERSARLGYWSIAYRGMKEAGLKAGMTVAVIGATGSMGLGAALLALAMGAAHVYAIARNRERLAELHSVDPARIRVFSIQDGEVAPRIREATTGKGVDFLIDVQSFVEPSTTQDALRAVGKRGKVVFVGGVQGKISLRYDWFEWNGTVISGSLNYLISDVEELARMMAVGLFPYQRFKTRSFGLGELRIAMEELGRLPSAFWSYVIDPKS